jgi:hypothetical protein
MVNFSRRDERTVLRMSVLSGAFLPWYADGSDHCFSWNETTRLSRGAIFRASRSFALALIEAGGARIGETLYATRGGEAPAPVLLTETDFLANAGASSGAGHDRRAGAETAREAAHA